MSWHQQGLESSRIFWRTLSAVTNPSKTGSPVPLDAHTLLLALNPHQTATSASSGHRAEHPVPRVPAHRAGFVGTHPHQPPPGSHAHHQTHSLRTRGKLLANIVHRNGCFPFLATSWQGALPNSKNMSCNLGRKGRAYKNHHSVKTEK